MSWLPHSRLNATAQQIVETALESVRAAAEAKHRTSVRSGVPQSMQLAEEFRAAIRAKYPQAFSFHRDVATVLEQAIAKPCHLTNEVARTADMLMVQAYKAHVSVYFLAVRALIEDAATITRRLLEIAVQTVYITGDSDSAECRHRALSSSCGSVE